MNRFALYEETAKGWVNRHAFPLALGLLSLLFLAVYFGDRVVVSIYPGEAGVIWHRFRGGTDLHKTYYEGIHVISPWDKFYVYDLRTQQINGKEDGLTKDGLAVTVQASLRFRPVAEYLPKLHQKYGPDYVNTIVKPDLSTALQEVVSQLRPEDLYTVGRKSGQHNVFDTMRSYIGKEYIEVVELTLTRVELPARVEDAIQSKLTEQQHSLEYEYRLDRERKEAERKRIEAQGNADAQNILASSLTEKMLMWKGLEATLELAKSPNTKIVVVGTGKGGLPLVLGNLDPTK